MKNQWLKIPLVYFVLSAVYYLLAYYLDLLNNKPGSNFSASLHNSLEGIIYWANTHVIYLFSLIGSSLVGLYWHYRKKQMVYAKGFSVVFITGVMALIVLVIVVVVS
jgi:hypothetical protein